MEINELRTSISESDPVGVRRWLIENPHNQINIGYLMLAINLGNIDIVNVLLDDPRVDPSVPDIIQDNKYVIEVAVEKQDVATVRRLLEDPRVDPSVNDNHAFDYALYELDNYDDQKWEVLELLEKDPRVQSKRNLNENKSN